MKPENMTLQAKLKDDDRWSHCSVDDILANVTIISASLSIVQRVSVAKWRAVLHEDLHHDGAFFILR